MSDVQTKAPSARIGYTCILASATCWGSSAVLAGQIIRHGIADATTISLTRVMFSWMVMTVILLAAGRRFFRIIPMDFFRFLFLGVIGIAGANFFLYYAIGYMDAAVADVLQFLAPTLVACYMVARGRESLDRPRIVALVMSLAGCALALGAFSKNWAAPPLAMGSALFSAVCFASVLVYGKTLSARYPVWTYLYYGLFAATLFWAVARPQYVENVFTGSLERIAILVGFGLVSILIPYTLFFQGLGRVAASKAGIVSTFEPVVAALVGWIFLSQQMHASQVVGVALVLGSIVLVELSPSSSR